MGWSWRNEHLDVILVPSGLLLMFGYHIFLLYRCLKVPHATAIGHENHNRAAWVERMMQLDSKDRGQAVSVISSNISAAISLSSISLVLSSLIGTWIGSGSTQSIFTSHLIYGDTSPSAVSIKYITLLCCFLVAFTSFVQTARFFVHASFLITMPNADIPIIYVENAVITGSNFWSIGMRSLYFATTLLLWIFGPIPMFVSSAVIVALLYNLDSKSTPLHQFQPPDGQNIFEKIGQEMTAAGRAIEHRGRGRGAEA